MGGEGVLQTLGGLFSLRKKLQCWNGGGGGTENFTTPFAILVREQMIAKMAGLVNGGISYTIFHKRQLRYFLQKNFINLCKYCLD